MAPHPAIDPDSSLWAWLAHDLRFYREKYGLSQSAMGKIIRRSATNLSNCEANRRRITDKEAKLLDVRFNTGGHFQRLLRFAQRGHDPEWFKQFTGLEQDANMIKTFQVLAIPGLLQTPEYAYAMIKAGGWSDPTPLVEERLARQAVLNSSSPALLRALITESALEWPVGGPEVMRSQLAYLLEASDRAHVSVRVVPKVTGAHPGFDGCFSIISGETGDVAYTESPGGGRLVPSTTEVQAYALRYDRISAVALPAQPSRAMIQQAMEAM
ncbi:helix-turn-helix domain-containing protein [Actinoallomurus iriomotensis]|uniref:Transcriptional regulator n=1 Tax=Actinoallomurus iriomotensis TaxID=478107 RepID=A0A9W6RC85_9ACTN|nr:helix-turn-helix transcriptional regulator [Actinoallomurus iriomotensis]GLY72944.1 transcriptional regulator [Actinoallomurus iriomotensis]